MDIIPIIPGRGLIQQSAIQSRLDFLNLHCNPVENIISHNLNTAGIQNNIESFIGSVEIPLGVVGPLLYKTTNKKELVYCVGGTLEGALIASMNRGARAVSLSGGFRASVLHQKMLRAPMFMFHEIGDEAKFEKWILINFESIKKQAEKHSNHAKLLTIDTICMGLNTHVKFIYSTGDASGQNMTTTCTWYAILWIAENFQLETKISIERFIIEGNASSDKKISEYTIKAGRGINVTSHCILKEEVLNRVLRTTSDDFMRAYTPSREISERDGMLGYNVNISNAIAAIFVATGQDLGSIHESSHGILFINKHSEGLALSLNLTNLVIGTVGGGTHLAKQKEALELMNCYGKGKVERFACLIAGFALALEISTYSAIVSGIFAKAHEKLGRNKPVKWMVKSEINADFVLKCIQNKEFAQTITSVENEWEAPVENGIITYLTGKVSKKLIGFFPATIHFPNGSERVIIKSKALDLEVINGLHLLAALIDIELADLIFKYKEKLEYWNCHTKEILMYEVLNVNNFTCIPAFYGKFIDVPREIHVFMIEYLDHKKITLINSQKKPELWTKKQIENTIEAITDIHIFFEQENNRENVKEVKEFKPWRALELYKKFIAIMLKESAGTNKIGFIKRLEHFPEELENVSNSLQIGKTIVHNDFNSRNIAIRENGQVCIYDWELAVIGIPHRDIVEFLSFVLVENFKPEDLYSYLYFHYSLYQKHTNCTKEAWQSGYIYAIKEYLVTRVSFYEVAGIEAKYAFSERILKNSFRMLDLINGK